MTTPRLVCIAGCGATVESASAFAKSHSSMSRSSSKIHLCSLSTIANAHGKMVAKHFPLSIKVHPPPSLVVRIVVNNGRGVVVFESQPFFGRSLLRDQKCIGGSQLRFFRRQRHSRLTRSFASHNERQCDEKCDRDKTELEHVVSDNGGIHRERVNDFEIAT